MGLRKLLLLALATARLAAADPAWQAELTSPAPGPHPPLPPSVMDLQLSWKGMLNAGKLRMETAPRDAKKPGFLVIRASASSIGPAAGLFPYHCDFWSEIEPASLRPRFFHSTETNRKKSVITTTRHFPGRVECREIATNLKTKTTTRSDQSFKFSPVFDIFSAMLHIRSQKLDSGDRLTLLIHPFDKPYLLRVKVIGREAHLDRKTIRLSVGLQKIDRLTLKPLPYKKMNRDATLWLSDDANRIPVEFRAPVYIGDVRAVLTGFAKH